MPLALWMTAGSVVSAFLVVGLYGADGGAGRAIWLGMLAPLVVVTVTWIVAESVYKRRPERLTSFMMSAFAGKLVFFGAYVGMAVGILKVPAVPFIISFTAYFLVLHLIEALSLKRMFIS